MSVTETSRERWTKRPVVSADDTLLTAAIDTMKHANIPADSYKPNPLQNAVEIAFEMDADGSSVVAYLFAARMGGDPVLVWTGTITGGTVESTGGGVWADTFATTTDNWITVIKELDASGNNRQARLIMDSCGYYEFFCQYTGISGETVRDHYSGF